MSISGIYLLISIHTLYHSQVLSLIQVHEITYFHHTLCLLKYTSAPFSSLAPIDSSRRTLSIYITLFTVYRGSLQAGICILHIMDTGRRANCTQRLRTGTSPTCSTSSASGGWYSVGGISPSAYWSIIGVTNAGRVPNSARICVIFISSSPWDGNRPLIFSIILTWYISYRIYNRDNAVRNVTIRRTQLNIGVCCKC